MEKALVKSIYCVIPFVALLSPAPLLAQDFGGLRLEGRVGWDKVGVALEVQDGINREFDGDASTFSYGGEIGYDLSLGGAVIGAYGGADFAQGEVCDSVLGNDRACVEAERNLTAGARVGFLVIPVVLLYAKGGYSNAQVGATYRSVGDLVNIEESASRAGYHVGLGAELGIGQLYGKVEYVHTRYNDFELGTSASGSINRNQVLAGLGIRF